jgi:large subunit ribosomal protein L32
MAQEPKKKHSKARKRTRRASITLDALNLVVCPNCNQKTLSHMACRNCGFYAGKKVGQEQVKVTKA